MPDALASNAFLLGAARQTNEATVPTTVEYAMPILNSDRPQPTRPYGRIVGTDGASITPDILYSPGQSWETSGAVEVAAFDDSVGRLLSFFYPTDTPSGTAPTRTHAFTGLGTAPPWVSLWSIAWTNGASPEYMRFSKGHATSIAFVVDNTGLPGLRVQLEGVGEDFLWTTSPTITTTNAFSGTLFRPVGATLKFDEDTGTPATRTSIQGCTLKINRPSPPLPTADAIAVPYLAPGIVTFEFSMQLVWENFDGFRSTYMGGIAGTAPSATRVDGSVELNFVAIGPNSATSTLKLSVPKVTLIFASPKPNPDGSPLILDVTGEINKPAAGEHVVPTLVNNVTAAY